MLIRILEHEKQGCLRIIDPPKYRMLRYPSTCFNATQTILGSFFWMISTQKEHECLNANQEAPGEIYCFNSKQDRNR